MTGGLQWPEDFRRRSNPDQLLQGHVKTYVDQLPMERVHILDVGAGPLTKLGKKHLSKQLVITATDVLANEYDRLLAELEIDPPIRTIYADVERLVEQFGPNAHDIVHGQNCIDHTANPLLAIEQMVAVSRPPGAVVLYHAENEGRTEQYRQLHQWDFTCQNGSFVIRDRRGRAIDVTERLSGFCEVECIRDDHGGILTGIRRSAR